jgi:hypothetical protein
VTSALGKSSYSSGKEAYMKPGLLALASFGLALILVAAPLTAREPSLEESGRSSPTREIDLPFDCLVLAEGLTLYEGSRYLDDAFPYLLAGKEDGSSILGHKLTPENLGHFLVKAPQKGGSVPAAIRTEKQARAAALLFIPGRLITKEAQAERIIAAAKLIQEEFEHLKPKVTDYRPESYQCTVRPLPQDRSIHPVEAWEVVFTALEVDRYLSLVHVKARVTAGGVVTFERHPIVDGPMTSWQTAVIGEYTEAHRQRDQKLYDEAAKARRVYCRAAGPAMTFEDLWATARVCLDLTELEPALGLTAPLAEAAGNRRTHHLSDGSKLVLKVEGDQVHWTRHHQAARLLHRIYKRGP